MNYLFRLDGAKENDEFFQAARQEPHVLYYAGLEVSVGPGWIPDGLDIRFSERGGRKTCVVTIIELEPTENLALVSLRKYLPVSSAEVVRALFHYLNRVASQCRSTGDPRLQQIEELAAALRSTDAIEVVTSGFLRNSAELLEALPLTDSGYGFPVLSARSTTVPDSFQFGGDLRLTPAQHKTLARCIRILDATVRGYDHSGARLKNWLGSRTQPLRGAVYAFPDLYPALRNLLMSERRRGTNVASRQIAHELASLWSATGRPWKPEGVTDLLNRYWPVAAKLGKLAPMSSVFDDARRAVDQRAA